jgi:hypothetical protein
MFTVRRMHCGPWGIYDIRSRFGLLSLFIFSRGSLARKAYCHRRPRDRFDSVWDANTPDGSQIPRKEGGRRVLLAVKQMKVALRFGLVHALA